MKDHQIPLDAAQLGLPRQAIVIVGGRTEQDIQAHVLASGGVLAEVALSAPDEDQPPPPRPTEADYAAATAAVDGMAVFRPDEVAAAALNAVFAARHNRWARGLSFMCPRCLSGSYHPQDVTNGYCGACHAFTGPPRR